MGEVCLGPGEQQPGHCVVTGSSLFASVMETGWAGLDGAASQGVAVRNRDFFLAC